MKLKALEFSQYDGTPRTWSVAGLALGEFNLVVGKNAVGKSRTLAIIGSLAKILTSKFNVSHSCKWDALFDDNGASIHYQLEYEGTKVVREMFEVDGEAKLTRGRGGYGEIFTQDLKRTMSFQTPDEVPAAVARRDKVQHMFLESLGAWAKSFRFYHFGNKLGQDVLTLFVKVETNQVDPSDENCTALLFKQGCDRFPGQFKEAVIADLLTIDYPVSDVMLAPPIDPIQLPMMGDPHILCVKESDLDAVTGQLEMSSGMFRALSIIVHLNYSILDNIQSCLLIDDIGEGLDFERSCALIGLIKVKTQDSSIQVIMSTNDRFVMNMVPIENWSVLERRGSRCNVRNFDNSREVFEEFKLTGLNNFDFFAMDFLGSSGADNEENGDIH